MVQYIVMSKEATAEILLMNAYDLDALDALCRKIRIYFLPCNS